MSLPVSEALRDRPLDRLAETTRTVRPPNLPRSTLPKIEVGGDSFEMEITPRHWETLWGMLCSLGVHLVILSILGLLVFETADRGNMASLVGILGKPGEELSADFILEDLPNLNPGGSEEELEVQSLPVVLHDVGGSAASATAGGGGIGSGIGEGEGDGLDVAVPSISVPAHAVTKGSFSAWTEPEDPVPTQDYVIMIQVRLPERLQKTKVYPARDISGMVIGTDGYKKVIRFKPSDKVDIQDGVIQFQLTIPGAAQLVRDTIRIESKLLKEKQVIQLVF